MTALRAWVATAAALYRAGRRALPDAVVTAYCYGLGHGMRTWHRLVVADLSMLIAVDEAVMEAIATGEVKEQVRR